MGMKRPRKDTLSALSRSVVCNGSEFHIEVVDDLQIGSTWTEPFDTEQAALDAALAAIEGDADRAYVGEFFGYRLQ